MPKSPFIKACALAAALVAAAAPLANAQELKCTVEINTDKLQTDKQVFQTLQQAAAEYMNTTAFTDAQFAPNERIECKLFFTISEYDGDMAKGTLQVQAIRPVYNTSYTSTVLNFQDSKIDFSYREGNPLVFNRMTMEDQITAILNYYAYLIMALDLDTFAQQGGEECWNKLKDIVLQGQSSGEAGWKAFEDTKNRAAVVSAFTDPATRSLRDLLYTYHRNGLDEMATSPDKGRSNITKALPVLTEVYGVAPMSVALSMWRDAKMDELVGIYSQAPADEREKAYEVLEPLYPTDQTRLNQIRKGKEGSSGR